MKYKFSVSTRKNKKYDVRFMLNGQLKKVSFGDKRYGQFKDKTPLRYYKHLDHLDPKRRASYYSRHGKQANKFSPKYFSHRYLW